MWLVCVSGKYLIRTIYIYIYMRYNESCMYRLRCVVCAIAIRISIKNVYMIICIDIVFVLGYRNNLSIGDSV